MLQQLLFHFFNFFFFVFCFYNLTCRTKVRMKYACVCMCELGFGAHIRRMQCSRLVFDSNQLYNYLTPPHALHSLRRTFCTKFMRFHFMKNFCNNFSKRFCGELKCEKNILRMATKNLRKTLARTHTHPHTHRETHTHCEAKQILVWSRQALFFFFFFCCIRPCPQMTFSSACQRQSYSRFSQLLHVI